LKHCSQRDVTAVGDSFNGRLAPVVHVLAKRIANSEPLLIPVSSGKVWSEKTQIWPAGVDVRIAAMFLPLITPVEDTPPDTVASVPGLEKSSFIAFHSLDRKSPWLLPPS
jgi:hypothetical protein